jgi:hypothetical protein
LDEIVYVLRKALAVGASGGLDEGRGHLFRRNYLEDLRPSLEVGLDGGFILVTDEIEFSGRGGSGVTANAVFAEEAVGGVFERRR